MRGLECDLGILQKSDGSATFQQGDTKVTCGVLGPAEVRVQREIIDKATLECIYKPKVGMPGVKEKALEEIVTKTCEEVVLVKQFPRSAIQVVMQLLQDSGSLLSCLINGACMALVLAGVPMKCMLSSVCCAIDKEGQITVDPSNEEEENMKCILTLSFESKGLQLISSHTSGSCSVGEYFTCLELARQSAVEVLSFQRLSVVRFLSKDKGVDDDESTNDEMD